jgi:ubiquitin-protein ligase
MNARMRRLWSDKAAIEELCVNSNLIAIEQAIGDPPEDYIILFHCRGIAQLRNGQPVFSHEHRVRIYLHTDYPRLEPSMQWLTPIFHPNISPNGHVCINKWYASKTLDELCLMLGSMIQYRNYAPYDALNAVAAHWAAMHPESFPVDGRELRQPDPIRSIRLL